METKEVSLNPCFNGRYSQSSMRIVNIYPSFVLILVLMEDTLRGKINSQVLMSLTSLNPCFNGRYSQRSDAIKEEIESTGLNPCFNGRYSQSRQITQNS